MKFGKILTILFLVFLCFLNCNKTYVNTNDIDSIYVEDDYTIKIKYNTLKLSNNIAVNIKDVEFLSHDEMKIGWWIPCGYEIFKYRIKIVLKSKKIIYIYFKKYDICIGSYNVLESLMENSK